MQQAVEFDKLDLRFSDSIEGSKEIPHALVITYYLTY